MQTDIYCIWEKQWCTFFSPQNHFATFCSTVVWDRSLLRSCPSREPQPSFQLWISSFLTGLFAHRSSRFRPDPHLFRGLGCYCLTVEIYWLDLPRKPVSQSKKSNKGNSTRNISKSRPSYLLWSQSFWYKTRLLQIFFFATVFKTV